MGQGVASLKSGCVMVMMTVKAVMMRRPLEAVLTLHKSLVQLASSLVLFMTAMTVAVSWR